MLQRVQAYTVTHTKLARVPSDLFSKGLNVTDTTGNKKGSYNVPIGVMESNGKRQLANAQHHPKAWYVL